MYVIDTRDSGWKKKSSTMSTISNSLNRIGMDLNSIANREQFGNNRALRQSVLKLSSKCILVSTNITYGTPIVNDCNEIIALANSQVLSNASSNIRKLCSDASREAQDLKKQIESATHSAENQNGSELEHYGRLGMKWGMHIFGKEKTYQKSMKKLRKLDEKSSKSRVKADVGVYNTSRYIRNYVLGGENPKDKKRAFKSMTKANKASVKSVKYEQKAKKLVEAMNKTFANETINSFSPEDIAIGEHYAVDVFQRVRNTSIRSIH